MFDHAILQMTAIYAGILIFLVVGFSTAMYMAACVEIDRERPFIRMSGTAIGRVMTDDNEIRTIIAERNKQMKGDLLTQIIIMDICLIVAGVGVSYLLARRTMKPIHEAYERQSEFVSDASHELRTPLTAMAMENEVLSRDNSATKDDLRGQIESNLEEVRKLQSLTNYLLRLSKSEKIHPEDRKAALEQIISILTENATKYGSTKTKVVREKNFIKVIDNGIGIAEEDLPHVFDRFYRAEKSRTTEGYGLGLALAKNLASQMDMKIIAENNAKKGATFTIIFS